MNFFSFFRSKTTGWKLDCIIIFFYERVDNVESFFNFTNSQQFNERRSS